jgi:SAM-dependent methyltransferase
MSKIADQHYLLAEQYRDASNLNARIQLHALFSTNTYGWHRWVFDQFDLPARCRILELGCGPGRLWLENLARIPASWDITLSDFSPGMLDEARRNLSDASHPFRFEVIDAQSIPFEDGHFDAAIANHMLYHVPDRQKALAEIRRVLRPGGRFYASTNGRAHLQEIDELVSRVESPAISREERLKAYFALENGPAEMSRCFVDVRVRRYADALLVTEAEPLVAFVLSGSVWPIRSDRVAAFRQLVERELAERSAIRISKDAGLIEARTLRGCLKIYHQATKTPRHTKTLLVILCALVSWW